MARMPVSVWKPLPRPSGTRMARYDLVVIHTMVGSLTGTDGYFRKLTNGVNSHFGTGGGGEIWQWVDTAVRSGANGAGNHRAITIENADMGPGFGAWNTRDGNAVPAFTPQQIEANAQICAWAHRVHGVPLVLADTSRPSARGIGFHRLGVNPHRVPDGELWSSSYGKTCPAPRRIAQIPQILARAKQIVGGPVTILPAPKPAPLPEEDMPFKPEEIRSLASDGVANRIITESGGKPVHTWEILRDLYHGQKAENAAVAALTKLVAQQNGLTVEDVRRVVSEEIAKGVDVDVTVAPGTSA